MLDNLDRSSSLQQLNQLFLSPPDIQPGTLCEVLDLEVLEVPDPWDPWDLGLDLRSGLEGLD